MNAVVYGRPETGCFFVWDWARKGPCKSALDILNPRFSLHVVDALRTKALHFNELARRIGLSSNTLRQRLKMLEAEGIVARKVESVMPPHVSYRLTEKGRALAEVLAHIRKWEEDWLESAPDSPHAAVLLQAAERSKEYGKREKDEA
jgi:DNA-binding HxlR family transcriptional regulator